MEKMDWSNHVRSVMTSDYDIISAIIKLHNKHVMFSPNMKIQQHARKTHSYYIVLKKREK